MSAQSEIAALRQQVASLEGIIRNQADRIENQATRIAGLKNELSEYRAENERDKATIRQQVTEAEQSTTAADAESDESAPSERSMTPMERMLQWGEDTITKHVTASDQRAHSIAEHYAQWASKAPNGLIVKDNLKNLLQTATGEKLAWNQVYRACRALVDFAGGAIEFTKHRRFGWILVAEPEYVTKLSRASSAAER